METINVAIMSGRIGSTPETYMHEGVEWCWFLLTTYRSLREPGGAKSRVVERHLIRMRKPATILPYLSKGKPVIIQGRNATELVEDGKGDRLLTGYVIATSVTFPAMRDIDE